VSTKIEWTNETWNPVTGCTKVSPGCDNCYAETFAERWRGTPGHHFENGFDLTLRPEAMFKPDTWKKPRRVFVNSMSDLFHRDVPDDFIQRVFLQMGCTPRHTFQVLTKRPERMRRLAPRFNNWKRGINTSTPSEGVYPNVWLGVSIENNDYAWRADMLRETPSAVRFLSVEPMLGPVDKVDLTDVDWVICGGESGHGARPMDPAWASDLRDRCVSDGIPFFLKQLGGSRDKRGGDDAVLDGRRWTEFPQPSTMRLEATA
jgi:protein gp37